MQQAQVLEVSPGSEGEFQDEMDQRLVNGPGSLQHPSFSKSLRVCDLDLGGGPPSAVVSVLGMTRI